MNNNFVNQSPYLRSTREFPPDTRNLVQEVNKSYLDIATAVNLRTIGIFPTNRPAITGESWYPSSAGRQQTVRQIYNLSTPGANPYNIPHGIQTTNISGFTRMWGVFTDGTNWYPLPYVDVTNVNNQISVKVSSTNIIITSGAGSPPSITSGYFVLEWIDQP